MIFRSLTAAALALSPTALLAQEAPPADAMALSEIVAGIESDLGADLAYIEDIQWDDDGYYEVEYRTADNREVDMRVDPRTGDAMAR